MRGLFRKQNSKYADADTGSPGQMNWQLVLVHALREESLFLIDHGPRILPARNPATALIVRASA